VDVVLRPLEAHEAAHVRWALYETVSWDPEHELPPYEALIDHPELSRYHAGWGRPGDLGVVAESGDRVVGVALLRLFTEEDHGHGFVDVTTPELAVAVAQGHRGGGIGGRLLTELAELARAAGFAQLSLSVDAENPALRLYERLGYRELARDEDGVRMLREL
jgi:ribosomal protein S18 acetylase RimI-like enzyme